MHWLRTKAELTSQVDIVPRRTEVAQLPRQPVHKVKRRCVVSQLVHCPPPMMLNNVTPCDCTIIWIWKSGGHGNSGAVRGFGLLAGLTRPRLDGCSTPLMCLLMKYSHVTSIYSSRETGRAKCYVECPWGRYKYSLVSNWRERCWSPP